MLTSLSKRLTSATCPHGIDRCVQNSIRFHHQCKLQASDCTSWPGGNLVGNEDANLEVTERHAPNLGPTLHPNTNRLPAPVDLMLVAPSWPDQPVKVEQTTCCHKKVVLVIMHAWVHGHIYIYLYTCRYVMYTYIYINKYVRMYTYIESVYIHTLSNLYLYIFMSIYMCMHLC